MASEKKQRWPAVALFFLLFLSYAYVNGGWGYNQYSRLDVLHSLVYHHTISIDAHHGNTGDKSMFEGHYYSDKAPGIVVLALPAYLISAGILSLAGVDAESGTAWNTSHWITSAGSVGLLTALGGMAFFFFLLRFLKPKYALITVLATFLGSLPFTYAILLFSHGAVIGLLCAALWIVYRSPQKNIRKYPRLRWDVAAGLCCGLALASEYTAGIACFGLFLLLWRSGWRRALCFSAGGLAALLLIPLYNWLCFHSLFAIGYTHVEGWGGMQKGFFGVTFPPNPDTIFALLFSMSRGLFFWTPFFLLACIGLFPLLKRDRWLGIIALLVCVLQVIAVSGYAYWDGGVALGPRHLAAAIPFFALLSGFGLQFLPRIGTFLAAASILLTGTASAISPGIPRVANPIIESYYPRILRSDFIQNWASLFGWRGMATLLPLALGIAAFAFFLFHAIHQKRNPAIDRFFATLKRLLAAPTAVFLFVTLITILAASRAGANGLRAESYAHWDSGHYLSIAERGYEFMSCSEVHGYDPKDWCGNTAWSPGFPLLIRALTALSLPAVTAGALLSNFFFLLVLILLWNIFLQDCPSSRRWSLLLLAGLFPGSIYYHAVFPVSTVLLCTLLLYWSLIRSRPFVAGICGFAAAFSYPTGILNAVVIGLEAIFSSSRKRRSQNFLKALGTGTLTALGFAAMLLFQYFSVGRWDAFFRVQEKYHYGLHNPLITLWGQVKSILVSPVSANPQSYQSLFVTLMLLCALWSLFRNRSKIARMDILASSYCGLFWLFPMILGGGLSIYRAESLLLPVVILLRRLPDWALLLFVTMGVILQFQLSALFFRGSLI